MYKNDYKTAWVIGISSGVLWFLILQDLALFSLFLRVAIGVAIPILCALAVAVARRFFHGRMFHKFVKFVLVGLLNTAIDLFIFDLLILITGIATGWGITLFKSIGFLAALWNSYEQNRLWTFDGDAAPSRTKREFATFMVITVIGFFLNVGATSFIANMVPPFGISQVRWDNVAAIAATVLNLVWNFAGYKFVVFRSGGAAAGANEVITPNAL